MSIITLARRLFHRSTQSAPVRFYAATKKENARVRQNALVIVIQLDAYNRHVPLEQRAAETEAYWARARQQPVRRRSAA